jgi:hypothetical protein
LSATNTFVVVVNEVNTPPTLMAQPDRVLRGLQSLSVTNIATDADFPPNGLSFSLLQAPAGATMDAQGVIIWTPTSLQVPSTNVFAAVVTDNNPWAINSQQLSATNRFTVTVVSPPAITGITLNNGNLALTWDSAAGSTYRVQYKNQLEETNWLDLPPDVAATGLTTTITNNIGSSSSRYFRVLMLP